MIRHVCLLAGFYCWVSLLAAQQYVIVANKSDHPLIDQWIRSQPYQQDSIAWKEARMQLMDALYQSGHLLATIDEWRFDKDTLYVSVAPGEEIRWANISFYAREYLPSQWVSRLNVSGERVQYNVWRQEVINVLEEARSQGYLLASYRLNVLSLVNDSLHAEVVFNPGQQIIFDTIEIEGNAHLSPAYLSRLALMQKGDPVNPENVDWLDHQLNNMKFVEQSRSPQIVLSDDKATIKVFLNNRNASAFDVLVGLQPGDAGQKLSITGYAELDLINQLSRGERIYLHLEKLRPRSQELQLQLSYPFLLNLPFGVEGSFDLEKNDTLYSIIKWRGGIVMPFGRDQFLRAGLTQEATNLIGFDRNRVLLTRQLPPYIDLRVNGFSLGITRSRLDFELNPRRGYSFMFDANVSQKKVRPNSLIEGLSDIDPSFDYTMLYDSLREPVTRLGAEASFQYFIPWGSQSTIRLAADAGAIKSGNHLFANEMFRLGGYNRLRGFDEQSILAQFYTILSAEYRLIISRAGYISLFADYAWIEIVDTQEPLTDHPYGFGFGLTLETQAGIFGMKAAAGAQRGNAVDFDQVRLHFGYVNLF